MLQMHRHSETAHIANEMPMASLVTQAQPPYGHSAQDFLTHRLRYYTDWTPQFSAAPLATLLSPPPITSLQRQQRVHAIEQLAHTTAELVIVTATKNRLHRLKELYATLVEQRSCPDWLWLVIDNGSNDGTMLSLAACNDARILAVSYTELTGCAFPVRNMGLDLLALGLKKNHHARQWILVLDSDDRLHNAYSLHEVASLRQAWSGRRLGQTLLHGFAVCEYEDDLGMMTYGTHPHRIAASFPRIDHLSDVFDTGLNILAGIFPVDVLSWLRYPAEFSFEDNGFNHKVLLHALRWKQKWLAVEYPITVKRFNNATMAAHNDRLGNPHIHGRIGEHAVTGVRAQIVSSLQRLRDYFHEQAL